MPACLACGGVFDAGTRYCPQDGVRLADAPLPTAADPLLGLVLDGKYRLDARLGEGGMGTVYRAVHLGMDRPVAIKLLRPQLARDPKAAKRFQREARSASLLDDPHCIRVTDCGESEGRSYLVMELLTGRPLSYELTGRRAMPPARAAEIAGQIARALVHAHGCGLVHRDLKPDNVFLVDPILPKRGDVVKVVDFGLAKLYDDEDKPGSLTEAGMVFGTPEYMSPEQAQGLPVGPPSDLYALGVVLFQMLTGELPFTGAAYMEILLAHLRLPAPSPAERRPDLGLPPALVELCRTCLAKDPAARPASAEALVAALAAIDLTAPGPRVPQALAASETVELGPPLSAPALAPVGVVDTKMTVPTPTGPVILSEGPSSARSRRTRAGSGRLVALALVAVIGATTWLFVRGPGTRPIAAGIAAGADAAPVMPGGASALAVAQADAAPSSPDAAPVRAASASAIADGGGSRIAVALRRAEAARRAQNRIQEIVRLQEVLDLDARHPAANLRLAEIALESGELPRACRHLGAARGTRRHKGAQALREQARCPALDP